MANATIETSEKTPASLTPAPLEPPSRKTDSEVTWQIKCERIGMYETFLAQRGAVYRECCLANYEVYDAAQKPVTAALEAYADELGTNINDGRGLFLYGSGGTGKDHLLAAMARRAIIGFGRRVVWVSGQQLFGRIRDAMNGDTTEESLVASYTKPSVLLLSDPSPIFGDVTSHQANMLYRIIDERCNFGRTTWTTINVKSREEANHKIGGPIVDRLAFNALSLQCKWPSYRQRKKTGGSEREAEHG